VRRVIAAAALLGLLGCQADETPSVVESGVGIVAHGCAGTTGEVGSGVAVDRPGQVVTTAHTVAGATMLTVVDSVGAELPATVLAFDKDADLALLDVPGLLAPPLAVGHADLGAARAVVWSPQDGVRSIPVSVTKRLSITIEDIYVEDEVHRSGLELVGEISTGDSGGAVVDGSGDVVGIIYARSRQRPGTAFATDHSELTGLLNDRPLDPTDRCQ
jgi:S1-C subfamily serine protease